MLTNNETKLIQAAEQNEQSASILLHQLFNCFGTDFCLRTAHGVFEDCKESFAEQLDPEDKMIQAVLLLGACRVIEMFSEFRAKGNEANES